MNSADIRQAFLDYFEKKGHTVVPSSSLVPGDDPTLLFTNAGMVPFKDVFLGSESRPYSRAASSQRCVRAGGKHNDLENVGYTARHHTFFEMLGNFSFGDYFKRDAIQFGWEFLTGVLGLPPEKLWVTVHISDDEAADIWIKEIGIDPTRFSRLDEDNFWQMGDTGPCGPSSEIFFDHGESIWGGPPGSPEEDGDRYIEIWNLVFMQFEKQPNGEMIELPNPSIDTGMGLERIAAVMQGVHNNYEIDLFQSLLRAAAEATGTTELSNQSLRVIADHIRSCSFLISDGVLPSNEGRGYVLRRIIRRALRHGHKLGATEPFFHQLVGSLAAEMGDAYPELRSGSEKIQKVLLAEEEQFARTLEHGLAVLNDAIAKVSGNQLSGEVVFQLYDTYGFPVDLTNDIAREHELEIDMEGYEECMEQQRSKARAAGKFAVDYTASIQLDGETQFLGYSSTAAQGEVLALYKDGESVDSLGEGEEGIIVLNQTSFYAESGGQVGDCGYLNSADSRFEVSDCLKQADHHLHVGKVLQGIIKLSDSVETFVDGEVRSATARNHSATHLLHAALREVLGDHVTQKGSLVDSERLRFDFSNSEPVSGEQLRQIERLVNDKIRENSEVKTEISSMDQAIANGAMALFGEKYADEVRVLTMGEGFSVELCGGTHVLRTGDIGLLRITNETGIAAGVRRVEAATGSKALDDVDSMADDLEKVAILIKSDRANLLGKTEQLVAQNRKLGRELETLKSKLAGSAGTDILEQAVTIADVRYLGAQVDGVDPKSLRQMVDQLKDRIKSGVVFLVSESNGKVALISGVTKDLTDRIQAGELLKQVCPIVGGKGGGRPDMAQGGGSDPAKIDQALNAANEWVQQTLS